jgi:hypothetical protein
VHAVKEARMGILAAQQPIRPFGHPCITVTGALDKSAYTWPDVLMCCAGHMTSMPGVKSSMQVFDLSTDLFTLGRAGQVR